MFITEEQARERLESSENLVNLLGTNSEGRIEVRAIKLPGKKPGSQNLSKEERTEIAIESRLGGRAREIASDHNVAEITVAKIREGKPRGIDEERVEKILGEARDRAMDRLMAALGLITDDKLSGASAKDLSTIASNMGRVVEKISTREQAANNVNVIIYSPELKKENSFKTIEI